MADAGELLAWVTMSLRIVTGLAGVTLVCAVALACKEPAPNGKGPNDVATPRAGAGEIACGSATCVVGREKCCRDEGKCEALRGLNEELCENGPAYQCDGREDCAAGEVCCQQWVASTGDDDLFATGCQRGACIFHEACRAGGCGPGFTCKLSSKPNVLGSCVVAEPKVACGGATCSGSQPVCMWDAQKKMAACGAATGADVGSGRVPFACSSAADCGGREHCCYSPMGTYCLGDCINAGIACATSADCPAESMGQKLKGCLAVGDDAPAGLKSCAY